ncbi:hypothetical protein PQD71_gp019 [Kosakonia phage Kc263]|uniref:Uncharacterized protein n=1 Tax=Kosakonia phage Kc263 TaxID=2863194 RepID=A0AAE8BGG8_9CAUD|nr:hypothetical protein PQD71_gp019 [Kosakonia phage Kc263]QYN79912.1 hypothetical protein [Kosakonia phage Kc263]
MDNEFRQLDLSNAVKECYGVLNDDILTVAAKIVNPQTGLSILDLKVNPIFHSGNHVPVGTIKATNDFYDELTGFYWFDVKVNPINRKAHFRFETTASVNGQSDSVAFDLDISGQSKTETNKVEFIGRDLYYSVSAKPGHSVFKHPLETKVTANLSEFQPRFMNDQSVGYLWKCEDFVEGKEICAIGNVMVDGVTELYLFRHTLTLPNLVEATATQTDTNVLNVKVTLDKPFGERPLVNGSVGYTENPDFGRWVIKGGKNLQVDGNQISFDIGIWDVKKKGLIDVDLIINIGDDANTPVNIGIPTSVQAWSDGEKTVTVTKLTHNVFNGIETLICQVNWKNSQGKVCDFTVIPDDPNVKVTVKENVFFLDRPVSLDRNRRNTFTLSGKLDLSEYGIAKKTTFSESVNMGSDFLPVKVSAIQAAIIEDAGSFIVALTTNNGSRLTDVVLNSVTVDDGPFGKYIREQRYDADTGYLQFKLDVALKDLTYPEVLLKAKLQLDVKFDDTPASVIVPVQVKATVDYQINASYIGTRYERAGEGYRGIAQWRVGDNNNSAPASVSIMGLKVNGKTTAFTKRYNQSTRILSAEFDIPVKSGHILHLNATISSPGVNHFVTLPDVLFTFYTPGAATVARQMFNPDKTHLTVQWNVQGWSSEIPSEVTLGEWQPLGGISTKMVYANYDNKLGLLTCTFALENPESDIFAAKNTIRITHADGNMYPLTFSYKL